MWKIIANSKKCTSGYTTSTFHIFIFLIGIQYNGVGYLTAFTYTLGGRLYEEFTNSLTLHTTALILLLYQPTRSHLGSWTPFPSQMEKLSGLLSFVLTLPSILKNVCSTTQLKKLINRDKGLRRRRNQSPLHMTEFVVNTEHHNYVLWTFRHIIQYTLQVWSLCFHILRHVFLLLTLEMLILSNTLTTLKEYHQRSLQ